VELEGLPVPPSLPGDGAALVAFMSFAAMRGFGAEHPYIALADRLAEHHRVRMGPLTTFYESRVDDREDAEKLEMAWQPAAGLAESLESLASALANDDEELRALLERAQVAGELGPQVAALREAIGPAVASSARVRLSYAL
jgi:hypothetical protein